MPFWGTGRAAAEKGEAREEFLPVCRAHLEEAAVATKRQSHPVVLPTPTENCCWLGGVGWGGCNLKAEFKLLFKNFWKYRQMTVALLASRERVLYVPLSSR